MKHIKKILCVLLAAGLLTALSCSAADGESEAGGTDASGTSADVTASQTETPVVEINPTDETESGSGSGEAVTYEKQPYTVNEPDAIDFTTYQVPAIVKNEDGLYTQTYLPVKIEGITTTFQTATTYSDFYRLPSDSVMVYVSNIASMDNVFSQWESQSENYQIDMMIAINRDNGEYVPRDESNYEDIQMRADGSYCVHTPPSAYYMVPTLDWTDYILELVEKAVTEHHPRTIVFEEPEMWHASGYSQGFKDEWKLYYGTDWEPQTASAGAMYRTMHLKTYLFERILTTVATRIKELDPTTKVYIATHSTINYNSWNITAGINNYLATGVIDGVIGQTWSDTAYSAVPYQGSNINDAYLSGYIDYASYLDSVEGTDFFALSDPMADNSSFSEKQCRTLYRQTVVASLMNAEIQRFQLFPWPSRSFVPVSTDYKTYQLNVFNALDEVAGKGVEITAGTPGIYFAISDSVSWQTEDNGWCADTNASVYGMTLPLVAKGIPIKMKSIENIKSAADLDGVKILILSYDCQKPGSETSNIAIADWVKAGGTLLYIGGHDTYETSETEWWADKGGTPLQNLLDHLGLDITVTKASGSNTKLLWTGDENIADVSDTVNKNQYLASKYRKYYAGFEGDMTTLITANDYVLACSQKAGEGNVVLVGIPSAFMASSKNSADLMRMLTKYCLESYTDLEYSESSMMTVKRGNVVAAHSIAVKGELTGKYIDLFDDKLSVLTTVTVPKDDSVLLYDISSLDLSVPRLGYTGGKRVGELTETKDKTEFTIYGPDATMASSRLIAPAGLYPAKVSATRNGEAIQVYHVWNNETSSLLIQVDIMPEAAVITVEWGTTPVADDSDYTFSELSVQTNSEGKDEKYLIKNTAGVNSGLRFCDKDGELIYKFDLTQYPNAVLTFNVIQNYILEYSLDNSTWTVIADYSKIGEWTKNGDNAAYYSITASEIGAGDVVYIRLRNTDTSQGWGGSITGFSIRYYTEN